MSKFILTNNKLWYTEISDCIKKAGFQLSGKYKVDVFLSAFKKLHVDNCNYYRCENDFVVSSGTFIYKEMLGKDALMALLNDASKMSVTDLRKNSYGAYAIIVKIKNNVRIFIDESQTYPLYYYNGTDGYFLCNTYYHVQKAVKQKAIPLHFAMQAASAGLYGERTPYKNIYRLQDNQYLEIDLDTGVFEKKSAVLNLYNFSFSNMDEAVTAFVDKIQKISQIRKKLFNKQALFCTGGGDSRLQLATHMMVGEKPRLVSMMSAQWILATKIEDQKIVNTMGEKLKLPVDRYHVTSRIQDTYKNITEKDYNKYGEFANFYANNKKFHQLLEKDIKAEFVNFGALEVNVRWEALNKNYKENRTLEEFIRELFIDDKLDNILSNYDEYYQIAYEDFKKIAIDLGLDINYLSPTDCMNLFIKRLCFFDVYLYNIAQFSNYTFPLLAQKEILDLTRSIPYEWKRTSTFNLYVINRLAPELLSFPFFSHCAPHIFDSEKMTLVHAGPHRPQKWEPTKEEMKDIGNIAENEMEYLFKWISERCLDFKNFTGLNFNEKSFFQIARPVDALFLQKMRHFLQMNSSKNFFISVNGFNIDKKESYKTITLFGLTIYKHIKFNYFQKNDEKSICGLRVKYIRHPIPSGIEYIYCLNDKQIFKKVKTKSNNIYYLGERKFLKINKI